MAMLAFPIKIHKSLKCQRCTMRYKARLGECPHCKSVPDGEALEQHIQKYRARLRANKNLGLGFLVLSGAFAVLLAVTLL